MFFGRLISTVRLFSSSATAQYPKLKSHSGAKKRWRSLGGGGFKRAGPCRGHLNVNKSAAQKNRLAQTAHAHGWQIPKLKKILPYGSP